MISVPSVRFHLALRQERTPWRDLRQAHGAGEDARRQGKYRRKPREGDTEKHSRTPNDYASTAGTRLLRTGEVVHEESAFTETAQVVLKGTEVTVRRDSKRPDGPFLADEATAASLLLETAEDARCQVLLRAGKRIPARSGAAWLGTKPAAGARGRLSWIVTPLPAGE